MSVVQAQYIVLGGCEQAGGIGRLVHGGEEERGGRRWRERVGQYGDGGHHSGGCYGEERSGRVCVGRGGGGAVGSSCR